MVRDQHRRGSVPRACALLVPVAVLVGALGLAGPATAGSPPVALFAVVPESGPTSTTFGFDASASWDAEDPPLALAVRWDFEGDGVWDTAWSATKVALHLYAVPGSYLADLEVLDSDGLTASAQRPVEVVNSPPVIGSFEVIPVQGLVGQEFHFVAFASDSDGDALSFALAYGDGKAEAGAAALGDGRVEAFHLYASAGTFLATLRVFDGRGGNATSSVLVPVIEPGFLRVSTALDVRPTAGVPARILVDGVPRDEWGLAWMKIAPGAHRIDFSDVPNFGTPQGVTVTVQAGRTTEVRGTYRAYGWLRVVTDPAVPGTISVDGIPRNDWGLWVAMPAGNYTVSFGPVRGFVAPPSQVAEVRAEKKTTVTGRYTYDGIAPGPDPSGYGLLRVVTRLSDGRLGVPAQILVDGIARDEWGLNWVKLPPGTYTVSFTDVPGLGTPGPVSARVDPGMTTAVEGVFQVRGWLQVVVVDRILRTALPSTLFVDDIPRDDGSLWAAFSPGSYEVSFGAVPGYAGASRIQVQVTAGQLTYVYVPLDPAGGTLAIEASPGTHDPAVAPSALRPSATQEGSGLAVPVYRRLRAEGPGWVSQ